MKKTILISIFLVSSTLIFAFDFDKNVENGSHFDSPFLTTNYNSFTRFKLNADFDLRQESFNYSVFKNNSKKPLILKPMTFSDVEIANYSNYNLGNLSMSSSYKNTSTGNKVGRFFLGAVVGAGCGALAAVLTHGDETYSGSGDRIDNSGKVAGFAIGGAIVGGILFVIDF